MTVQVQDPVITYTGNGSVDTFSFGFRVILVTDMKVYLDGVIQTTGYAVTGVDDPVGGDVVFTAAPANGVVVRLQRLVSLDRETDYIHGGALNADTLDVDIDRMVHQIQDLDRISFKENSLGHIDAGTRRVTNVIDPVDNQDAATKYWSLTTGASFVGSASASASAAGLSETNAGASETAAALSETNAGASETAAALSETNAAASETAAALSETAAALSETNAGLSETNAGLSETNAAASETAAAVSETNAGASVTSLNGVSGVASSTTPTFNIQGVQTQHILAVEHNIVPILSNIAAGSSITVILKATTTDRTITYNSSWIQIGYLPTTIPVNKTLLLSFVSTSALDTGVVVTGGLQV